MNTPADSAHRGGSARLTRPAPILALGREASWQTRLPDAGAALLLFTACDGTRLDHAVGLVRSIELFSPGVAVVVHVVNPSRHDIERLRLLAGELEATRLAVSVEKAAVAALSDSRQAYIAQVHFFRIAEILHELSCPVLALPANSLVVGPLPSAERPTAEVALGNGGVWLRPTAGAGAWLEALTQGLIAAIRDPAAPAGVGAPGAAPVATATGVARLDPAWCDLTMASSSLVWTAGGGAPTDLRFVTLQRLLIGDTHDRSLTMRLAAELLANERPDAARLRERVCAARARLPPSVALFLPRLDQPWGAASSRHRPPPQIAAETLALRLHWKEFASLLANAIERHGIHVEPIEWPLRDIVPEAVDLLGASLALVPHRCKLDYRSGRTPVLFYMQEYFRWVFVVDPDGWSAASSLYPIDPARFVDAPAGAFDQYRQRLEQDQLSSKFGQPGALTRDELEQSNQIPRVPYIFVPLQIPHDQSIRYFSAHSASEVVAALVRWSNERGVPLVLKPHPVNPKSMAEFEALPRGDLLYWSTANVRSLIDHAAAVYTINSGVGFEALLQVKPVVTFGRAEYDCVTIPARLDALDAAWQAVQSARPEAMLTRYRAFVDWFLSCYAVDLSLETTARQRLDALADSIAARVARPTRAAKVHTALAPLTP